MVAVNVVFDQLGAGATGRGDARPPARGAAVGAGVLQRVAAGPGAGAAVAAIRRGEAGRRHVRQVRPCFALVLPLFGPCLAPV